MNRVEYQDYTVDYVIPEKPVNSRPPVIRIIIFCVILAVAAMVFLRGSISDMTQAHVIKAQEAADRRRQAEEKEALKLQLQAKLPVVVAKLNELEDAINKFATQFESITKIPLNQIRVMNTRKTNQLKLQSDSFLLAWTQIVNARISVEALDPQRQVLSQVGRHIDRSTHDTVHVSWLDDVLTWINDQHQTLQSQQTNLDQIRASLL